MRKKLKQTITIGTVLAGSVLLVNVPEAKANETTESTSTTPDSELIIKTKEGKTTEKDVEVAKVQSDTAKERTDALTETVAEKTDKVKSAEEKVSKVESTKKASESVTPEKIKELESETTKTTTEKAAKEKELVNKQEDLKAKQADLNTEKQGLETAKTSIQDKKAKADELRGKIKELAPSLKELEDKKAEKVELEQKVKDLTKAQEEKTDALKVAKEKDKTISDEKVKATADMNQQKEVLAKAKTDEQTAKEKETEAKTNLESNSRLFKYALKEAKLAPEFVEGYKKYRRNEITLEELKAIELEVLEKYEKENYFFEDDKNGDETVDVNNLSEKDKEEFSQYFVYLLNQVRAQFGLEPRRVNKNTQKLADDIAKYSRTSNYQEMGHDKESIKKAAKEHGLQEGQFYENLTTTSEMVNEQGSIRTKREIFHDIRNSIFDFFYEGNLNGHYRHAESLLENDPTTAVNFSYKELINDEGDKVYHLRFHVVSVALSTVRDKATAEARFGKTSKDNLEPLKVPSQAELRQAYDKAKTEAEAKAEQVKVEQAKYDALVNKVKSYDNVVPSSPQAQAELDAVNTELDKAQQELKAVVDTIKTLEDKKAIADEKVRQLQGQLNTLTNEIKALEDNLVAKEQAVRNAEAKVEEAKTEIANLTSDIQSLTDKLANLEREHTSALELRAKYDKIEKDLEIAKEELALAKEELDLEKEKLKDANTKAKLAYDKYIAIKKQHELEKLTYAVTKDTPVLEKLEFHFEIPKDAPVLEKPEFDIKSLNKPTKPLNSTNSTTIVEKETSNTQKGAILPKAGEKSNSSVAVGLMVLVASLVLNRRKAK